MSLTPALTLNAILQQIFKDSMCRITSVESFDLEVLICHMPVTYVLSPQMGVKIATFFYIFYSVNVIRYYRVRE